jgi:single-strand DNA-binding protein
MSRGYNRVTLMGNLARDPDVRRTAAKQAVARFTLAVSGEWKDKATGEKKGRVDFIPCQAWGALAGVAERYLVKGRAVLVDGRISVREYQGKDGGRKWATDVIVGNLLLLPSGNRDGGGTAPRQDAGGDDYGGDFPLDMSDMGGIEDGECPF